MMVYLILALLFTYVVSNPALTAIRHQQLPILTQQVRTVYGRNARLLGMGLVLAIILFDMAMVNYDNNEGAMGLIYAAFALVAGVYGIGLLLPAKT